MNTRNQEMIKELEEYLKNYQKELYETTEELRFKPMPKLTEELFSLFETTGNRIQYENIYFHRRKYLSAYGIQAILYHKREDIEKLTEVLFDICEEECWALPAHVNRKEDPNWRIRVDLFASETAQSLAEIITSLSDELSESVQKRVKDEVFRRVLIPFYESDIPYDSWERCENNWCAVCNGAIGSASIDLMQDDKSRLFSCLDRICESLPYFVSGFSEDGACMEGLSYFTYGMTYFTGFAQKLYDYTKGKKNLIKNGRIKKIAEFQSKCYFRGGRSLSFSDGNSRERFRVGLTCYLAMCFPNAEIPNMDRAADFYADSCYRFMGNYRDIIWTQEYIKKLKEKEERHTINQRKENMIKELGRQTTFRQAQWTICESENNVAMAAKGGHNEEPHNHNDVGSFLYVVGNTMMLEDLGAGEYTQKYFSDKRYEILCNSSLGHNVPLINNKGQLSGKEHGCNMFLTDGRGITCISFEKAYEKGEIRSLVRSFDFDIKSGKLKVIDHFIPSRQTKKITENLVTQILPIIKDRKIYLEKEENKTTCITIAGSIMPIRVVEREHSDHKGEKKKVYLIQWDVEITGAETRAQILIEPNKL